MMSGPRGVSWTSTHVPFTTTPPGRRKNISEDLGVTQIFDQPVRGIVHGIV